MPPGSQYEYLLVFCDNIVRMIWVLDFWWEETFPWVIFGSESCDRLVFLQFIKDQNTILRSRPPMKKTHSDYFVHDIPGIWQELLHKVCFAKDLSIKTTCHLTPKHAVFFLHTRDVTFLDGTFPLAAWRSLLPPLPADLPASSRLHSHVLNECFH